MAERHTRIRPPSHTPLRPGAKPPFQAAHPQMAPLPVIPKSRFTDLTPISDLTTMKLDRWRHWLSRSSERSASYQQLHPDLCERILQGIEFGVPVDYEGDRSKDRFGPNLRILPEHVDKVSKVIDDDAKARKKAGPFDSKPFPRMCISPIGAVPKHGTNKVRVIHHLSYPHHGDSVNAGVVEEHMHLPSFGHAARAVQEMGRGCFLIKLDVEAAYKQVPVRREDWPLLGFMWQGKWYYERVLPFGLRSSCRLWELYAAALHFFIHSILPMHGPRRTIHYVDDFLFVVQGEKAIADQLLANTLELCADLGLPMAADKTVGPVTMSSPSSDLSSTVSAWKRDCQRLATSPCSNSC